MYNLKRNIQLFGQILICSVLFLFLGRFADVSVPKSNLLVPAKRVDVQVSAAKGEEKGKTNVEDMLAEDSSFDSKMTGDSEGVPDMYTSFLSNFGTALSFVIQVKCASLQVIETHLFTKVPTYEGLYILFHRLKICHFS